jgi:hypothetical protein
MVKRLSILATVTAGLLVILGWSFIVPTHAQTALPEVPPGQLRVVNAMVGIGPIDVYLNNLTIAYGLAPQTATVYFAVPMGRYVLAVRPAGADPYSVPIGDVLVDVASDASLTAIAYQTTFATPDYSPPIAQSGAIHLVTDDRSPMPLGQTRLSAVNLAVGAPEALTVGYPQAPLLSHIALEQSYGSIDIQAGEYNLTLMDAVRPDQPVIERYGDQTFYGNTLYTLVMVPNVQPPPALDLAQRQLAVGSSDPRLLIISAPLNPHSDGIRLRIVHAAFNYQLLDVYIDGRLIASGLNYGSYSEYLALPNQRHTITLRRLNAASDAAPLAEGIITVPPEQKDQTNWTLLLLNGLERNEQALSQSQLVNQDYPLMITDAGSRILMSVSPDNLSETNPGYSRLRLYHAVDGLPPITLYTPDNVLYDLIPGSVATPVFTPTVDPLLGGPPLKSLVNQTLYGGVAGETEVRTGLYNEMNILLSGNGSEVQTLPGIHLVPGVVYTEVVIGSLSSNPPIEVLKLNDFGFGSSIFEPGQLPTATAIPVIVTRVPPTSTLPAPSGPVGQPSPAQSGSSGGQSNPPSSGGSGNSQSTVPPTAVPPTPVPPTPVPPTPVPPTPVPPTPVPPTPVPPTSEPPTSEPPTSEPPTSEPATPDPGGGGSGGVIDLPLLPPIELPPIIPTLLGG